MIQVKLGQRHAAFDPHIAFAQRWNTNGGLTVAILAVAEGYWYSKLRASSLPLPSLPVSIAAVLYRYDSDVVHSNGAPKWDRSKGGGTAEIVARSLLLAPRVVLSVPPSGQTGQDRPDGTDALQKKRREMEKKGETTEATADWMLFT